MIQTHLEYFKHDFLLEKPPLFGRSLGCVYNVVECILIKYLINSENNKNILWKDNYLFNMADTNSDGFISFSEYSFAWGARNRLDREQINRVIRLPYLYEHFKQMDIDKDGLLNFNEFIYDISKSFK